MGSQIRVSPDVMRQRAQEYRKEAETVNGVIGRMDNLLKKLEGEFEGSASRQYSERYQELRPGFQKAQELIVEISEALDKIAAKYEELDVNIAKSL